MGFPFLVEPPQGGLLVGFYPYFGRANCVFPQSHIPRLGAPLRPYEPFASEMTKGNPNAHPSLGASSRPGTASAPPAIMRNRATMKVTEGASLKRAQETATPMKGEAA